MNPSDDYKLTDLDYLIGDHHLQMIKASSVSKSSIVFLSS